MSKEKSFFERQLEEIQRQVYTDYGLPIEALIPDNGPRNLSVGKWFPDCPLKDAGAGQPVSTQLGRLHDSTITRLSALLTEKLGTPYEVTIERDVAWDQLDVVFRCACCKFDSFQFAGTIEAVECLAELFIDRVLGSRVIEGESICRCVDGLTPEQCLQRYSYLMRCDSWPAAFIASHEHSGLTPAQRHAASVAWSASLREKQQEQREKERNEIVCERDEDGE